MKIPHDKSFVVWRKPGEPVKMIVAQSVIAFRQELLDGILTKDGYLIAPFDVENHPFVFLSGDVHEVEMDSLPQKVNAACNTPLVADADTYLKQAHTYISQIQGGHLHKVILSRVINEELKDANLSGVFAQLCSKYASAYVFWFYTPYTGMWMGATPELFLRKQDDECFTVALAGTRKGENDEAGSWQQKELHEQELVSDFIRNVLQSHHAEALVQQGPETVQAGQMKHLRTSFQFKVNANDALDTLILDLHPTPAVCGLPKDAAMTLIRETEQHDRSFYGGFNGYVGGGNVQLFVSLRCMQLSSGNAFLYVGGGITGASDAHAEWDETVLKSQTLLSVLKNI
jgi:isochorismate synthase